MTDREKLAREWAEEAADNGAYGLSEKTAAAIDHIFATTTPPTMADVEWDDEEHRLAGVTTPGGVEEVMMWHDDTGGTDHIITDRAEWRPDQLTPNGKRYELVEVTDKPENPVEPSTKTMDEYSPVERADMVGMWAGYNRYEAGGEPEDFLIITGEETEAGRVPCYNPGAPTPHAWAPDPWMLTPRFDMPRAWGKDGEPCEPTVSFGENVGVDQPDHPEVLTTVEDYQNAPPGTVLDDRYAPPFTKANTDVWVNPYSRTSNEEMADSTFKVLRWGWGDEA